MLIILVTFINSAGNKITAPLAYANLPGLEAPDLFHAVKATLEEHGLGKDCLVAFCAGGASVMGTRSSLSGHNEGNNVARLLQDFCEHPLLVQHCAPHKLQLAVEFAFQQSQYLKEMEKRIRALFSHLSASPASGDSAAASRRRPYSQTYQFCGGPSRHTFPHASALSRPLQTPRQYRSCRRCVKQVSGQTSGAT